MIMIMIMIILTINNARNNGRALRRARRRGGFFSSAMHNLYEEFTGLAETRLAQNLSNYPIIA